MRDARSKEADPLGAVSHHQRDSPPLRHPSRIAPPFLAHKEIRLPEISMLIRLARSIAPTAPPLLAPSPTASASTVRRVSTRQVSPALRFAASIIATGLIAGLVGRACTLLLHRVEIIV